MALDTTKTLYSPNDFAECLDRIGQLTEDASPQWGSMSAAQMLSHCADILEVTNGADLKGTPFIARLLKGMIRNMVVNEKPYPRNTRTHPQYLQSEDRDFEAEKSRLLSELEAFRSGEGSTGKPHPLFGSMSKAEKGWSSYKHLDHHLTQFGV